MILNYLLVNLIQNHVSLSVTNGLLMTNRLHLFGQPNTNFLPNKILGKTVLGPSFIRHFITGYHLPCVIHEREREREREREGQTLTMYIWRQYTCLLCFHYEGQAIIKQWILLLAYKFSYRANVRYSIVDSYEATSFDKKHFHFKNLSLLRINELSYHY